MARELCTLSSALILHVLIRLLRLKVALISYVLRLAYWWTGRGGGGAATAVVGTWHCWQACGRGCTVGWSIYITYAVLYVNYGVTRIDN